MNQVEKEYSKKLKKMKPARRLQIAIELENLVLEIAKEGIRNKYKGKNSNFVNQQLKKRILTGQELETLWIKKKHLLKS